jgi:hypothetical protein
MPGTIAHHDQQTERTNKLVGTVVGCVVLTVVGFLALQNVDSLKGLKLPDRNKLWADAWKKELSKPTELPDFKGNTIDWSDPKNDPSKLAEQPWAKGSPLFQQQPLGNGRLR